MNANMPPAPETKPDETAPSITGPAQAEATRTNYKLMAGLIGGGVVLLIVAVLIIAFLSADPARTANIRDMFIIALAFASLVIGVLLVVLVWQLQSLVLLLRNEIRPMLVNINQTVNTLRGTTVFMSDNVARPAIKAASFFSGLMGAASALTGKAGRGSPGSSAGAGTGSSNPGPSGPP